MCVALRFVLSIKTLSTLYDVLIFSSVMCNTGRGNGDVTGIVGMSNDNELVNFNPAPVPSVNFIHVTALYIAFCLYFSLLARSVYLVFCVLS